MAASAIAVDKDVEHEIHRLDPAFAPPKRLLEIDVPAPVLTRLKVGNPDGVPIALS